MGLSVFLPPGDGDSLQVDLSFADYDPVPREDDSRLGPLWRRVPHEVVGIEVPLVQARLSAGITVPDTDGLRLKGELGSTNLPGLPPGTRVLSLFLVNERTPQEKHRDEAFIFQVRMTLHYAHGFLPRPNRRGETSEDWDQRVLARPAVVERGKRLLQAFDAEQPGQVFPGLRFYLLHSLSHLLLTTISLECGYSASSLRERIFCSRAGDTPQMAGILITTGTTGSEGTLGGLVEEGRRMRHHLRHAWELGRLCSNDPVCAAHDPASKHADRRTEGAACHGCLYVSEPSCERHNRYLDRALVVPTLGNDPTLAFFAERP